MPVPSNTALIIEPNEFHGETLPGYYALLRRFGFNCWIIAHPSIDVEGSFSRVFNRDGLIVLRLNPFFIALLLRSSCSHKFCLLFFNSSMIASPYGYFGGVVEYVGRLPQLKKGCFLIEHSVRHLSERAKSDVVDHRRMFALREVRTEPHQLPMLAPVEFGHFVRTPLKRKIHFITIGRASTEFRDFAQLIDAVTSLLDLGISNFQISVVGDGGVGMLVPNNIRKKMTFHGYLPFADMFTLLEQSHFVLPLLDSRNNAHLRYIEDVTSGSRQLIFGFEKIGIWDSFFAGEYGFDENNAIVHMPGQLMQAMRSAVEMNDETYAMKMDAVASKKKEIFNKSIYNLGTALGIAMQ